MRKKAARPQRIVEEKDDEDEAENEQPNALLAPIAEARFTTHAPISICIRAPDDKFHIFSDLGVLQENVSQSVTVAWEHSMKHIVISQPDQLHGDGASTSYAIPSASSSSRVLAKVRPPAIEEGNLLFSLLASGHLGLTTHRNHSTSLCLAIHSCTFNPTVFKSSDDDIEDYTDVDPSSPHAHLLAILSWLHPESSEATSRGFASVEELFSMLRPPSEPTDPGVSFIQPPRLLPSLRPYQVGAQIMFPTFRISPTFLPLSGRCSPMDEEEGEARGEGQCLASILARDQINRSLSTTSVRQHLQWASFE